MDLIRTVEMRPSLGGSPQLTDSCMMYGSSSLIPPSLPACMQPLSRCPSTLLAMELLRWPSLPTRTSTSPSSGRRRPPPVRARSDAQGTCRSSAVPTPPPPCLSHEITACMHTIPRREPVLSMHACVEFPWLLPALLHGSQPFTVLFRAFAARPGGSLSPQGPLCRRTGCLCAVTSSTTSAREAPAATCIRPPTCRRVKPWVEGQVVAWPPTNMRVKCGTQHECCVGQHHVDIASDKAHHCETCRPALVPTPHTLLPLLTILPGKGVVAVTPPFRGTDMLLCAPTAPLSIPSPCLARSRSVRVAAACLPGLLPGCLSGG